jgi:FkbH-like protein
LIRRELTTLALNIGVIADFNAANLVRLLDKHFAVLGDATVTAAPYAQVMQTLLQPSAEFWDRSYDVIVLWTFPGSVVERFNDVLDFQEWSVSDLDRDVDAFVEVVRSVERRVRTVLLPSWVAPTGSPHSPSIEMRRGIGATAALLRMNLRLVDSLDSNPGVVLFNTERWLRHGGRNAFSDKLWYLSKTPCSNAVFEEAAREMVATVQGLSGLRKKVIVLDLDNTLWGGILGDAGADGIQIGGHDPSGEAYLQFQTELKRLSRQGVMLAVVSKNDEAIAIEVIDQHPEMLLRPRDFAAWRINWADKAQNIVEVMRDLNLGLDSAVFIDDSPHERSRVRQALPEVLVPEWPSDPMDYAKALRELRCFEHPSLTHEDRQRTAMYVSDRERKELQTELGSLEKWLEMLDLEVQVEQLTPVNLARAAQLLNKTNQLNLTGRRMSAQELANWASHENHDLWTFRVKDKLGDYGLCAIASVAFDGSRADLVDFLLSCRAMGRGIEEAIISVVARKVRDAGGQRLIASYIATTKNKPCIRWIEQNSWFVRDNADHTFLIDVNRDLPPPKHIRVTLSPS